MDQGPPADQSVSVSDSAPALGSGTNSSASASASNPAAAAVPFIWRWPVNTSTAVNATAAPSFSQPNQLTQLAQSMQQLGGSRATASTGFGSAAPHDAQFYWGSFFSSAAWSGNAAFSFNSSPPNPFSGASGAALSFTPPTADLNDDAKLRPLTSAIAADEGAHKSVIEHLPKIPKPSATSDERPFSLPLPFESDSSSVRSASASPPICGLEQDIALISGAIRSKPNWRVKSKDPAIVERWRTESFDIFRRGQRTFRYRTHALKWKMEDFIDRHHLFDEKKRDDQDETNEHDNDEQDVNVNEDEDLFGSEQDLISDSETREAYEREKDEKAKQLLIGPYLEKQKKQFNAAFQYMMDELAYYEEIEELGREFGAITMSAVDGVFSSDQLLDSALQSELLDAVHAFQAAIPREQRDYHPDSDSLVVDWIHPSLFPLIAGVSGVLEPQECDASPTALDSALLQSGGGSHYRFNEPADLHDHSYLRRANRDRSDYFQWLPSEVQVSAAGRVRLLSYINNLHPRKHGKLYSVIERVIERFVPLLSAVVEFSSPVYLNRSKRRIRFPVHNHGNPPRLRAELEKKRPKSKSHAAAAVAGMYYDDSQSWQRVIDFLPFSEHRHTYKTPTYRALHNRRLQLIIKLATIELSPENPQYHGGTWHVEGMINECIVASGIYYLSMENITESLLQFRRSVSVNHADYQSSLNDELRAFYRVDDEAPLLNLGSVLTYSGRALAWPNIYQHRVAPFQLTDPSKPGHRHILCFFLVDPDRPVVSTLHVPPQSWEWVAEEIERLRLLDDFLIRDVQPIVLEYLQGDFITMDEAKQFRVRLMEERKAHITDNNERMFAVREFSLCEH